MKIFVLMKQDDDYREEAIAAFLDQTTAEDEAARRNYLDRNDTYGYFHYIATVLVNPPLSKIDVPKRKLYSLRIRDGDYEIISSREWMDYRESDEAFFEGAYIGLFPGVYVESTISFEDAKEKGIEYLKRKNPPVLPVR